MTRCLRDLFPPETIVTTDVGSIKLIVSQAWRSYQPLTFFESNGLSAMGYGLPAAMAAKLAMPDRPVLCTMGDGGFSMVFADLETCVRRRIPLVTVVYNDSTLSLIQVAQAKRGYVDYGVRYEFSFMTSSNFDDIATNMGTAYLNGTLFGALPLGVEVYYSVDNHTYRTWGVTLSGSVRW